MPANSPAMPWNTGADRHAPAFSSPAPILCPVPAILCLIFAFAFFAAPAGAAAPVFYVGAPADDQLSRFADAVAANMQPAPKVLFAPGLGGAYALRDAAADPVAVAVVALPALILLREDPNNPFSNGLLDVVFLAARVPVALWAPEQSAVKNLPDFVALARGGGAPVIAAGPGRLTAAHLAVSMFNRAAGVSTLYLPLIGTEQARAAALEGRATAVWAYALAPGSMPGMRALAVAAETRSPILPDVPTFAEYGLGVSVEAELGFALPLKALGAAATASVLRAGLGAPQTADTLARMGFLPLAAPAGPLLEGPELAAHLSETARELGLFKRDYPRFME